MKIRRLVAILAIGALVTTAAACSSDSDDDKSTNGDKSEQSTDGDDSSNGAGDSADADDTTQETVSDDEFASQMADLSANIKAAGTDVCKLMEALQVNPPQPANATQVKEFVGVWTQLLDSIGATLGGDDEKVVKKAAADFKAVLESKDYDPAIFDDDEAISSALDSAEMNAAMERFSEMSAKCFTDDEGGDITADTDAEG